MHLFVGISSTFEWTDSKEWGGAEVKEQKEERSECERKGQNTSKENNIQCIHDDEDMMTWLNAYWEKNRRPFYLKLAQSKCSC